MKADREHIVTLILAQIEAGNNYSATKSAVVCGNLRMSERTFDKYWKEAQNRYSEVASRRQSMIHEQSDAVIQKRQEGAIISRERRLEIASAIAEGRPWEAQGEWVIPSAGDRIRALDWLAKVEGDYTPVKTDVTTNDLRATVVIVPPTEDE